jgi:peptidoglycan hydrolase-like protein with peptidoglycan-binding domain
VKLGDAFEARPRALVDLGGPPRATATATATSVFASNDILKRYQPTGASAATAAQDGLSAGVGASHRMADTDRSRLLPYKEEFASAAQRYGVPPAVLAAIASRESRGGAALDSNGLGDNGNGFGLMQVDKRYHTPAGGPYSQAHINQAASILRDYLDQVRTKHPSWPPEQQLRGAITAYNSGVSNVQTIEGMDRGTTGNDYSNDVWARAMRLSNDFGGQVSGPTDPNPTPGTWTKAPSLFDVRTVPETFLRPGQEGEAVKTLQKLLGVPASEQDGKFGSATQQAVQAFQKAHGLTPPAGKEGWVGKTTLEALERAAFPESPSTAYTPAPTLEQVRTVPETFLRKGQEGDAVKHLQQLLGLKDEAVTGRFDERTHQAVLDFQQAKGLTPPAGKEGWVGKTTLEHLEKAQGTPAPTPGTWTPAPALADVQAGKAVLKQGMEGAAVKELQRLLGFSAEEQDGKFGKMTHDAVHAFQKQRGLTPPPGSEGVVGKTTLEALQKQPPLEGGKAVTGYANGQPRNITVYPIGEGHFAQAAVARNFKAMVAEARAAGINLGVNSGWRSNEEQAELYRRYLNGTGNKAAPPGYSNHQMGLSIDIGNVGGYNTRAYNWLKENAGRFGFVNDVAGEFWHWTYTRDPARLAAAPSVETLSAGGTHNHAHGGGCC